MNDVPTYPDIPKGEAAAYSGDPTAPIDGTVEIVVKTTKVATADAMGAQRVQIEEDLPALSQKTALPECPEGEKDDDPAPENLSTFTAKKEMRTARNDIMTYGLRVTVPMKIPKPTVLPLQRSDMHRTFRRMLGRPV